MARTKKFDVGVITLININVQKNQEQSGLIKCCLWKRTHFEFMHKLVHVRDKIM